MCFLRQCCTHSLCPTLWPLCPKTGSVLAMQPLCRSHGWTVVNHYYTPNWGHHVFFAAMLHSQFVPHIVVLQSWVGLGHAAFVQKQWLDCGKSLLHSNWGLTMCFLRQCCTHSLWPMLQNWLGLGHAAFVQKSWLEVMAHKWGLTMCFLRQWTLCAPKLGRWPRSLCAEVMIGLW